MKLAKNKELIRKINKIFDFLGTEKTEEDFFFSLGKENSGFNEFAKSILDEKFSASLNSDDIFTALSYSLEVFFSEGKTKAEEFLEIFENIVLGYPAKWVAIFPLNYNTILQLPSQLPLKRSLTIGSFVFSPYRKSAKYFKIFYERKYNLRGLGLEEINHQNRMTKELLFNAPILSFEVNGSEQIARRRALEYYDFFSWVQNLFIALTGKRFAFINESQKICLHFLLMNEGTRKILRFPVHSTLSLNGENRILGQLNDDLLKQVQSSDFKKIVNLIFLEDKIKTGKKKGEFEDEFFGRIFNSLKFFSKGFTSDDNVSRLLFYMISVEALFSKDKYTPLRVTLADCISLLHPVLSERAHIHKEVRNLYDLRSAIVHSGEHKVFSKDVASAEELFSKSIYECIKWYIKEKSDKDGQRKDGQRTKDRFFEDLLNLKLTGTGL